MTVGCPFQLNDPIYMQHSPSLRALKLFHLMIAKAGGRMADDARHDVRLSEIRAIDGMAHHDQESLKPLFAELRSATMIYDEPEKKRWSIGGLLDHGTADYRHELTGDVLISWWFGKMFKDMARQSNHWAIIDRQTVFHLGSKYSVLIFQHIASLVKLDHTSSKCFTVPELRALLGVSEGKLERFADLNRRALQPAIAEINQLSRLTLAATLHKTGRTVTSVTISWVEKEPDQKRDTKRELDASKAGRKARRDGTAETPVMIFPGDGSISYGPWAEVVRKHAPQPTPDVNLVASDFRKWCRLKSIPLDAASIESTFVGFCRTYCPPN